MKSLRQSKGQRGFTIVELLIATTVLSVILLLSTVVITGIGNLFYKSVNQSRLQDDLRIIADDVSQHLSLSDQSLQHPARSALGVDVYCIGTTRYSYVTSIQIGVGTKHVLWRDVNTSGACMALDIVTQTPPTTATSTNGVELIAPNSLLTDFTITPTTSPYSISVGVAFGDVNFVNLGSNATCKNGAGDQFCSTANLQTVASQRLSGGP